MIKALIVDDEFSARESLKNYLQKFCRDINLVGSVETIEDAYKAINKLHPKLLFLDIRLSGGMSGFDLLDRFDTIDFKIIFVTAYSEFAQRAFRYYATDYLLKPVNINELIEAVERVKGELIEKGINNDNIYALKKRNHLKEGDFDILVIRDTSGFKIIETKDIILCKSEGPYTHFFLTGKRRETTSKNLKFYEETLEKPPFIRSHNSYIVNLKHIKRYNNIDRQIYLTEDLTADVGDKYREEFLKLFS